MHELVLRGAQFRGALLHLGLQGVVCRLQRLAVGKLLSNGALALDDDHHRRAPARLRASAALMATVRAAACCGASSSTRISRQRSWLTLRSVAR